jgi:asparagine synthase (glutamine-hydrolysing)
VASPIPKLKPYPSGYRWMDCCKRATVPSVARGRWDRRAEWAQVRQLLLAAVMCGIAGIVHHDRYAPVSGDILRVMCDALRHRGPDDEGIHVSDGAGLGMRRLSIIDLSGGHQPIFNEDHSKAIVFNGEIYNYRELRRGLIARGHTFRSDSDTETILHLYEELGPRCVTALRGMFSFAIWDAASESLLLARDRFGIKPLYVAEGPWGIAFASELKSLLAAGLSQRELDWEALDCFFQLGYIPAPATPFRDVRKLEPGHTLVWRRTGHEPTIERYWDLPTAVNPEPPNVERRVLEWLDESVRAHLVSDVPVSAFLSGGLDSSAVVSSMALQDEQPHAFTARYHGSGASDADETALACQLAARYQAKLTVVDIRPDVRDIFEPIVRALDEPHADDSAIPTWLLSQAVASQYKVALTGIGGDELFAGYRRHIGMLIGGYYSRLPRAVQNVAGALAGKLREPAGASLGVSRVKRFFRTGTSAQAGRFLGYLSRVDDDLRSALYTPALRAAISGRAAQSRFDEVYRRGGSPAGLRAGLYLDYKTFLPDDLLALSDRLSMAHSLEIRVPFVDHLLVERAFSLPDRTKIGWGSKKQLLKRVLAPRLSREHLTAPKRGFVGPTAAWLRNELRGMLEDELSEQRLKRLGYFAPATVHRLLTEHFTRRHNHEGILLGLLCFSTWHRLYAETPAAATRAFPPEMAAGHAGATLPSDPAAAEA